MVKELDNKDLILRSVIVNFVGHHTNYEDRDHYKLAASEMYAKTLAFLHEHNLPVTVESVENNKEQIIDYMRKNTKEDIIAGKTDHFTGDEDTDAKAAKKKKVVAIATLLVIGILIFVITKGE